MACRYERNRMEPQHWGMLGVIGGAFITGLLAYIGGKAAAKINRQAQVDTTTIRAGADVRVAELEALPEALRTTQGQVNDLRAEMKELRAEIEQLKHQVDTTERKLAVACRHIERMHDHRCDPSRHPYPTLPEILREHVDPSVWNSTS